MDELILKMKESLTKDPLQGPGIALLNQCHYTCWMHLDAKISVFFSVKVRDKILESELLSKHENDRAFIRDVMSELPERVENTLQNHKTRMLGGSHLNVPRDEYDPTQLLSQITGGKNVIVLDSHNPDCLPPGWKEIDPQALFVPPEERGGGGADVLRHEPDGDAPPEERGGGGASVVHDEQELQDGIIPPHDPLNGTILEAYGDNEEHKERVMVYTTLYLIALLAQVKSGIGYFCLQTNILQARVQIPRNNQVPHVLNLAVHLVILRHFYY